MVVTPRQLEQRAEFYRQLGTLTEAGLSLLQGLESLGRGRGSRVYQAPIRRLIDRLEAGETFSEASASIRGWMPPFDRALFQAGERSGRLDTCFATLAEFYRQRAEAVRSVFRQLTYPLFVVHAAILLAPFPQWFLTGDGGRYLQKVLTILVPLYVILFLGYYLAQGRHGFAMRSVLERMVNLIPFVGRAQKSLAIARLTLSLEALLAAGTHMARAWQHAADASGSPAIQREVGPYIAQIEAGRTPGELLEGSRFFPDVFVSLYSSGEVSGRLDENLKRLQRHYQDEGFAKLRLFSSWLPKLIYFGIVAYLAVYILRFYGAYFDQINNLSDF